MFVSLFSFDGCICAVCSLHPSKMSFFDQYIWDIQYINESKCLEKSIFLRFITAKKAHIFEHIKDFESL